MWPRCAVEAPPWPNGQGVGLLIRRLRVRVPQGVIFCNLHRSLGGQACREAGSDTDRQAFLRKSANKWSKLCAVFQLHSYTDLVLCACVLEVLVHPLVCPASLLALNFCVCFWALLWAQLSFFKDCEPKQSGGCCVCVLGMQAYAFSKLSFTNANCHLHEKLDGLN